jgi:uncharacterized protein (UPF0216 family)
MDRQELETSWKRTSKQLEAAWTLLSAEARSVGNLDGSRYAHYLERNELELALDELEWIGAGVPVPVEFWEHLKRAAQNMELSEHAERYGRVLSEYTD